MKKVLCTVLVLVLLGVYVTAWADSFLTPVFVANYGQYAEMLGVPGMTTDFDTQDKDENTTVMYYDCLSVQSGKNDFMVKEAMLLYRFEGSKDSEMDLRAQAFFMACMQQNSTSDITMVTIGKLAKEVEPHMEALKKALTEKAEALEAGQIVFLYMDDNWAYSLFSTNGMIAVYATPM